jgi:hypothetical protein
VPGYNHRFKGRIAVTGYIQWHFPQVGLQCFTTEPITAVATVFARRIMLGITEMLIDLSLQKGFNSLLVRLLKESFKFFLSPDLFWCFFRNLE